MSSHKTSLSTNEHDKFFERYMNENLRLEQVKTKRKEIGGSLTDEQESDIKYITDRKGAILRTYIVKSMANLTYFFKFINENPELIKNFDKDIEKIMGLNMSIGSKKSPFAMMLRQFIGEEYFDVLPQFSYRIQLLRIMQFLIRQKADWVSMNLNYPKDPTRNDYEMRAMMIDDLRKAETWMGYLDQSISRIPSSTAGMYNKQSKEKEKIIKPNCKTIIPKMKEKFAKKPLYS